MVLKVFAAQLEDGNGPILAHGRKMLQLLPTATESVTFGVQYELADAATEADRWSSVDIVTVTREGAVSA